MGNINSQGRRVIAKRYQYWGPNGKKWTNWFPYNGSDEEKWQLKSQGLKNEYKYE